MNSDQILSGIAFIAKYILPVVGVVALVYLALLFRKLIETLKEVDRTLILAEDQVRKLDAPLATVEDLSHTVDDVHHKTREAVTNAADSVKKNAVVAKTWFEEKRNSSNLPEDPEALKEWVMEKKDNVFNMVSEKGEAVKDKVEQIKTESKEFPINHTKEEDEHE